MREHLYLPGTLIEDLPLNTESRETPNNIFDTLRPLFDALWNACGFPKSITLMLKEIHSIEIVFEFRLTRLKEANNTLRERLGNNR